MEQARFLIGDDEADVRDTLAAMLAQTGHRVETAATGDEVLERVRAAHYDLLLSDLIFPPTDGIHLLKQVKALRPSMLVVLISGFASVDKVLAAFRNGAYDFLEKPIPVERVLELASRALDIRQMGEKRRKLVEELESERLRVMQLKQQLSQDDPFQKIVGNSLLVAQIVETIREVARTDSTVLLTGESGTGKGLVARAIHEVSSRCEGPFVEANCVVYSEGVLHSELFGHEKGAFTGAARQKKGRFELAGGGTLFLDEIGEISTATQLLLLRVLQERTFERVGGEDTLEADVRLIAATNRDLQEALRHGTFRSDLFYRLNVIPLHLPPLREHPDDVPVLAQHFLTRCAARIGRPAGGFSPEAMDVLMRYRWPGNVRELENTVERVVVLNRSGLVELADLPPGVRQGVGRTPTEGVPGTLQSLERGRILEVLREAHGNKKKAAAALGIHRSTLYAKLRRYGLLDPADVPEDEGRDRRHLLSGSTTPTTTSSKS